MDVLEISTVVIFRGAGGGGLSNIYNLVKAYISDKEILDTIIGLVSNIEKYNVKKLISKGIREKINPLDKYVYGQLILIDDENLGIIINDGVMIVLSNESYKIINIDYKKNLDEKYKYEKYKYLQI